MVRNLMMAMAIAAVAVVMVADTAEAGRRHRRGGCGGGRGGCGGGYSDCGGGGGGCGGYATTGCGGCNSGCEAAVPYHNGPEPDYNTMPPAPTGDSPSNIPEPPQAAAPVERTIVTTAPQTTYRAASTRRGLFGRRS